MSETPSRIRTGVAAVILLGALVAAGLGFTAPWRPNHDPAVVEAISALDGEWVGRPAPDFTLPDLAGERQRLRDYRGRVVFLNFWASFCKPCKREMPSMERLARQYDDRGMVMLAVSLDAERQDAQGFLNRFLPEQRSAMEVLWDPNGEVSHRYGTTLIPETYIIDRNGRIVARFVNEYDWTRPEAKQLVEALLR
jgi:peroxiredoxin